MALGAEKQGFRVLFREQAFTRLPLRFFFFFESLTANVFSFFIFEGRCIALLVNVQM